MKESTPKVFTPKEYKPKELSTLWKMYFSNISISMAKLFFKNTREHISVRYKQRNVVMSREYLDKLNPNSITFAFKINPINGTGIIFFSDDLANYLVNSFLGGLNSKVELNRELSSTDAKLLNNTLGDIYGLLLSQMKEDRIEVEFENIQPNLLNFVSNSSAANEMISVQQFVVEVANNSFLLDIAFSNRLIE